MNIDMRQTLLRVGALLLLSSLTAALPQWSEDYAVASRQAAESGKDILLLIVDPSDPWSEEFETKVARNPECEEPLQAEYVLVRLSRSKLAAVKELSFLPLQSVPGLVQALPSGIPYSLAEPGPSLSQRKAKRKTVAGEWLQPAATLKDLQRRRAMFRGLAEESLSLAKQLDQAPTEQRWAVWETCALKLEESGASVWPVPYQPLVVAVRTALADDPENKLGKKARACKLLLTTKTANDLDHESVRSLDPSNQLGLLEMVVCEEIRKDLDACQNRDSEAWLGATSGEPTLAEVQAALDALTNNLTTAHQRLTTLMDKHGFRESDLGSQACFEIALVSGALGYFLSDSEKGDPILAKPEIRKVVKDHGAKLQKIAKDCDARKRKLQKP